MIYEIRTYTCQPGTVPEVEKRFEEALPDRQQISPLVAFFHTEMGPLNQILHIWAYEDLGERTRLRAEASKLSNWPPKISEFLIDMESEIAIPAPFMRPIQPATLGNFYEMRIYTYRAGTMPEVIKRWSDAIADREKISPLAACWSSELGALNRWTHIWPYQDLNERMRLRAEGFKLPNWPPATREFLVRQDVKLLVPASFSPLK